MAVHHLTVTITTTGVAQPLSTTNNPSINCREIQIQNPAANANVYVGGSTVTTTDYGKVLVATATVPDSLTLRDGGNNINLASTYIVGTATQNVNVLYVQ